MTGNELRKLYLKFFEEKNHLIQPSYSLIPDKDPSLLLIAAGMAPLKPFFSGEIVPPARRITTCQKCIRTNDIENVGHTTRHHTFFEMLGNFSFGDYFKKEAIEWAWEFVVKYLKLDPNRIYVSIHTNDEEAFIIWSQNVGLPINKIVRLKDNFWEIGPGPCGPCSELYYDRGQEYGCLSEKCGVGCNCNRYLEFWNLVFTQFNKQEDGRYIPLNKKNIDTGIGLERILSIIQNTPSNYETDLIFPIIQWISNLTNYKYGIDKNFDIFLKVIADHSRSFIIMLSDGILPSNEGRGYVLRRILRRAIRYGKLFGISEPFLVNIVDTVAEIFQEPYPQIQQNIEHIKQIIYNEEKKFNETLLQGLEILNKNINELKFKNEKELSGEKVFKLYDTYGFPWELVREIANEKGISIDEKGFHRSMEKQKLRARSARKELSQKINLPEFSDLIKTPTNYSSKFSEGEIKLIFIEKKILRRASENQEVSIILDKTSFYPKGGGQIYDTGKIIGRNGIFEVATVEKISDGIIFHTGKIIRGYFDLNENVNLEPDVEKNKLTAYNHTSTHILHSILKKILGKHVNQAGSLVTAEKLRFDFTHYEPLTYVQLQLIEEAVNKIIFKGLKILSYYQTTKEAKKSNAIALFSEKYGNIVRVVEINNFSKELCVGSHAKQTNEIGFFKIINEESVAGGIRRIEAVTNVVAVQEIQKNFNVILKICDILKLKNNKEKILEKIKQQYEKIISLEKTIEKLNFKLSKTQVEFLLKNIESCSNLNILISETNIDNINNLKYSIDILKEKISNGFTLLGANINNKAYFICYAGEKAQHFKVYAKNIIKIVAQISGGKGGGKNDLAQAGGGNPNLIIKALEKSSQVIKKIIKNKG